jgi:hypothetical protein
MSTIRSGHAPSFLRSISSPKIRRCCDRTGGSLLQPPAPVGRLQGRRRGLQRQAAAEVYRELNFDCCFRNKSWRDKCRSPIPKILKCRRPLERFKYEMPSRRGSESTQMKKPVVNPSERDCPECMGAGFAVVKHPTRPGVRIYQACKECLGKGRIATS